MERMVLGVDELIKNAYSFQSFFANLFSSYYLYILVFPYMSFFALPFIYTDDSDSLYLLRDGKEIRVSASNLSFVDSS
ncbi:MAG: hypothetical protein QW735_04295 [archaeon]